jgi:hypothetical protein
MPPIKHTQLFDFPAYVQAIKDVKTETVSFGKTVEDMIKQKVMVEQLKEYAEVMKNFNVAKPGASDGLKGYNTSINDAIAKMNDLKAVQAGLANIVDLNAASVKELRAEYSGLKKQYEGLKPTQKDYAQQVEQIKARIKEVVPGITAYTNAIKASKMGMDAAEGTYRRMQQELTQLKNQLKDLPGAFDAVTGKLNKANPEAVNLTDRINKLDVALKHADEQMGVFGRNVGNYKSAFNGLGMSFTQIARELPSLAINLQTFMLAISNNLPMVFDQIGETRKQIAALRAEGQQAPSLWKQMGSALFSFQLLLSVGVTLLTVYGAKVIEWAAAALKGKKALDEFKRSQELINEAMDTSDYAENIANIKELAINIDLAKKGLISKEGVLKQYNESIGKTTGLVNDLDEAEKALAKNADAYVKMMLYKAAANLALEEAAKKTIEAEKLRMRQLEEFTSVKDRPTGRGAVVMPGSGSFNANEFKRQQEEEKRFAEQRRRDLIKQVEDAEKTLTDIGARLQNKAAEIAKKNNFDIFSGFGEKDAKDKEKQYEKFVRNQQAFLEKTAELEIKQNELKLARKEITEEQFEKRKLELVEGYVMRAIKLEESLGQKADKARIEDYKGKLSDQQLEYEKFLQKLDEKEIEFDRKKNSRVRSTPVDIQKLPDGGKVAKSPGEKAIADIERRAKAEVDAENKAFDIIRAGRDTSFKEEIAHLERLKAIKIKYKQDTAEEEYAIAKAHEERERQLRQETEQLIFDTISTGMQIISEISNANIQQRITNLEAEKQRELDAAGNNAAAREAIEKNYNQRIAKEKRKQAQNEKNMALFQVAINTATGIAKTIAQWGMPWATPFITIALAQGLIQSALIASKPIPQFRKGTKNAPKGVAVTGEDGFELIERRGQFFRSGDGPTLTMLEGGEKIFTHDESKRMLENSMKSQEAKQLAETAVLHGALAAQLRKGKQLESIHIMAEAMQHRGMFKEEMREIMKEAMAGIVIENTIIDERGFHRQVQQGNMRITDLNNRYKF